MGWEASQLCTVEQRTFSIIFVIILEHISKAGAIVVLSHNRVTFTWVGCDLLSIFLIELAVFPDQQVPKSQGKQCGEKHKCRTD
jgi:hypothetical protein